MTIVQNTTLLAYFNAIILKIIIGATTCYKQTYKTYTHKRRKIHRHILNNHKCFNTVQTINRHKNKYKRETERDRERQRERDRERETERERGRERETKRVMTLHLECQYLVYYRATFSIL